MSKFAIATLAAKAGLGPLLLVQGAFVRYRTIELPEPVGPRTGTRGCGSPLRLLIVGDSAAAGVGVADQCDGLLGQVVAALAPNHKVEFTLWAKTGATSAATRARLEATPAQPFDVIITSLGVNDVTRDRAMDHVLDDHRANLALLRTKFSAQLIIASALPPVGQFPALPQPLRWYIGWQCRVLDRHFDAFYSAEPDCHYHRLPATMGRQGDIPVADAMARDGYHPGAPVYALWGLSIAAVIRQRFGSVTVA